MNPLRHIAKGSFGYHVLTLAGGTLAGQLILFVSLPFLQRYFYGPEAFGVFTLYVALSEFLIDFSGLKYELAIINNKRGKDTVNTFLLSLLSVGFFSLLIGTVLAVLYFLLPHTQFVQELGPALFLVPVSVLCFGSFNTLNYWLNNKEKYRLMSAGKVINSLASEPAKFALASPTRHSGLGLITGRVLGQMALFVFNIGLFLRYDRQMLRLASRRHILRMGKIHRNYPLFIMPGMMISTGISYFFFQFVFTVFGNEKVGLVGPSISYIGVAFGILSTAFAQVFYKRISTVSDYGHLRSLYLKFAGLLFLPGLAVCIGSYLLPVEWIVHLLGERWRELLPITRIMVLWMVFSSVATSLNHIHLRMGTQRILFGLEVLHLALVSAGLFGGYLFSKSFYGTLYAFSAVQILYYAILISVSVFLLSARKNGKNKVI